jgi:hypothetical protein
VRFRDPKYSDDYIFPAVRLDGAEDPPKVLKPGDLTPEQSRNWRPMVGMAHSNQRASLDSSGHRALSHEGYDRNRQNGQGRYSNMPPPRDSNVYRSEGTLHNNRYQPYNADNRRGGGGGGGYYNRGKYSVLK